MGLDLAVDGNGVYLGPFTAVDGNGLMIVNKSMRKWRCATPSTNSFGFGDLDLEPMLSRLQTVNQNGLRITSIRAHLTTSVQ